MSKYRNLVAAMEEAENMEVVPAETSEVAEAQLEVAEDVAEIIEGAEEIEELNAAIENATEDAEKLEEIQEILEETVEEGEGIDETAAQIAEVAVEQIRERLGIATRLLPAQESFGSKSSRLTATRVAIEGFSEQVTRIWEAIKKALKSALEKIIELWNRVFDGVESTAKLSKSVREELKAAVKDGRTVAAAEKIEAKALAAAFNVDGAVDYKTIFANHVALTGNLPKFVAAVKKTMGTVDAAVKAGDVEGFAKVQSELAEAVESLASGSGSFADGKVALGPFVNGATTVVAADDSSVTVSSEGAAKPAASEVEVLSQSDAAALLDMVDSLIESTRAFKKAQADLKAAVDSGVKVTDTVMAAVKKAFSKEDETISPELKAATEKARKTVTTVSSAASRILSQVPAANATAAKRGVEYVRASVAQYKKAE